MADLTFDDIGTVTVTIGADTYKLRRPTLGQLQHYTDRLREISEAVQHRLGELAQEIQDLLPENVAEDWVAPDEIAEKQAELTAEIRRMRNEPHEYLTIPWLREVFSKLGSEPLPADLEDAPAAFASMELPREIIIWWRSVPLARGGKARR